VIGVGQGIDADAVAHEAAHARVDAPPAAAVIPGNAARAAGAAVEWIIVEIDALAATLTVRALRDALPVRTDRTEAARVVAEAAVALREAEVDAFVAAACGRRRAARWRLTDPARAGLARTAVTKAPAAVARVVRGVDALVAARRVVALGAGSGLAADPLDALAATSGEAEKERERDESNDPHPGRTTI
jgi:hypothetical protein